MLGQTGQVSATVADAVSGPAAPLVTAEADTSSEGSAAAPVTGADLAGRTATASCDYQVLYGFTGFQAPVDNDVVNVAKAGTATPLKSALAVSSDRSGRGRPAPALADPGRAGLINDRPDRLSRSRVQIRGSPDSMAAP